MAFRQPTFAPASRPTTSHEPEQDTRATVPSTLHRGIEDSHEWVLFPSAQANSRTQTQSSTERTPQTVGLSRLSDFGSLAARSRRDDGIACEATDGSLEDDEDLDSLDEGLHAFQEQSVQQRVGGFDQSGSILPRHDGLGTFPPSSPPMQEQLWHFEQYNPRKRSIVGHQRRRSSIQRRFDALEDNDAVLLEGERRDRIENWRMEQSRVLLDEIEKETRKRRSSVAERRTEYVPSSAGLEHIVKESVLTQTEDPGQNEDKGVENPACEDDESIWQRITRRIIRDFIGIDDGLLSVIFGESLPEDRPTSSHSSGLNPSKSIRLNSSLPAPSGSGWEERLLERLARELGILVQHLSEHPGAFSSSYNTSTSDYAGMPVTVPTSSKSQPKPSAITANVGLGSAASFNFNPTLQDVNLPAPASTTDSAHAALWGIEEEPSSDAEQKERDYWEQTPDIKTVFRFLRNRFTSQRRPSTVSKPANIATTSTPDSLRRAAVIRQYHPLVSRAAAAWEQRHGHARRHSLLRGRSGSSCASSIVGSARRGVVVRGSSLASSSRNYWDLGGSTVGSGGGSAIAGGGIGAWGEV